MEGEDATAPILSFIDSPNATGMLFSSAQSIQNFELDTTSRSGFAFSDRVVYARDAAGRVQQETHDFCLTCGLPTGVGAGNLPPHGFGTTSYT